MPKEFDLPTFRVYMPDESIMYMQLNGAHIMGYHVKDGKIIDRICFRGRNAYTGEETNEVANKWYDEIHAPIMQKMHEIEKFLAQMVAIDLGLVFDDELYLRPITQERIDDRADEYDEKF